jgi:hypothetical protein
MTTSDPKVFKLRHPIPHAGGQVDEITFRRPRARDFIAYAEAKTGPDGRERSDVAAVVALIASVASVPLVVIEDMDAEDFAPLLREAQDFIERASAVVATPASS